LVRKVCGEPESVGREGARRTDKSHFRGPDGCRIGAPARFGDGFKKPLIFDPDYFVAVALYVTVDCVCRLVQTC
jgi:hypothetical protein